MTAINKKLAAKAQCQAFLKFETGVMDKKRQEKRKMEDMKKNMIGTIEEMEKKIESTEVHLEDKRMVIEELGMGLMEMAVTIESGSLSEVEWEKIEDKKNGLEIKKLHRMRQFQKKKEGLTALVMKKKELETEVYRIQQYLVKFKMELKEKEKVAMVEMVLCRDKDQKADVPVSIVSNTIKHVQTFLIMPKCIIYVMFITILYFFYRVRTRNGVSEVMENTEVMERKRRKCMRWIG